MRHAYERGQKWLYPWIDGVYAKAFAPNWLTLMWSVGAACVWVCVCEVQKGCISVANTMPWRRRGTKWFLARGILILVTKLRPPFLFYIQRINLSATPVHARSLDWERAQKFLITDLDLANSEEHLFRSQNDKCGECQQVGLPQSSRFSPEFSQDFLVFRFKLIWTVINSLFAMAANINVLAPFCVLCIWVFRTLIESNQLIYNVSNDLPCTPATSQPCIGTVYYVPRLPASGHTHHQITASKFQMWNGRRYPASHRWHTKYVGAAAVAFVPTKPLLIRFFMRAM